MLSNYMFSRILFRAVMSATNSATHKTNQEQNM